MRSCSFYSLLNVYMLPNENAKLELLVVNQRVCSRPFYWNIFINNNCLFFRCFTSVGFQDDGDPLQDVSLSPICLRVFLILTLFFIIIFHSSTLSAPWLCGSLFDFFCLRSRIRTLVRAKTNLCFFFFLHLYVLKNCKTYGYFSSQTPYKTFQFIVNFSWIFARNSFKTVNLCLCRFLLFSERHYRSRDRPRARILARACAAWQRQLPQCRPWQR